MFADWHSRLSLSKPPLPTHLDVIKFVCKDLFLHLYARGIDNLRTNHRVRACVMLRPDQG